MAQKQAQDNKPYTLLNGFNITTGHERDYNK